MSLRFVISGEDCFAIGRYAYNQQLWKHTREWMLTALERFDEESDSSLDIPSVYDHLAFSEYSVCKILICVSMCIHNCTCMSMFCLFITYLKLLFFSYSLET